MIYRFQAIQSEKCKAIQIIIHSTKALKSIAIWAKQMHPRSKDLMEFPTRNLVSTNHPNIRAEMNPSRYQDSGDYLTNPNRFYIIGN